MTPKILAFLALPMLGCVGTPTPLAPSLRGTVGVPHQGVQTDAIELPVSGLGFERYRKRGANHWATPRLVSAVTRAAADVQREYPGGQPLVIGDFSARHGGKIPGHNSHRTGRDVDLLFYVTSPRGVPRTSPGFVALDSDGLGKLNDDGDFVQLDVPRNWALVRSLLENPEIGVQFMFASHKVETLLIDYALAKREPLELVYRAQTVLLEPRDSTPHDDHIHLRVACAPEEGVTGCNGGGPYWQWLPQSPISPPVDPGLLAAIAAEDPPVFETLAETALLPGGA